MESERGKWGFKALKQICKALFVLGRYGLLVLMPHHMISSLSVPNIHYLIDPAPTVECHEGPPPPGNYQDSCFATRRDGTKFKPSFINSLQELYPPA